MDWNCLEIRKMLVAGDRRCSAQIGYMIRDGLR
jgi:hypothetical protein